jgi:hypothetical protein
METKIEIVNLTGNNVSEYGCTTRQIQYIEALMLQHGLQDDFQKHIMCNGSIGAMRRLTKASASKLIDALKLNRPIKFVTADHNIDPHAMLKRVLIGKG